MSDGQFGTSAKVSQNCLKGPKCLDTLALGHFGTSAELSWVRSVLGPKCPYNPKTTKNSVIITL